MATDPTAAQFSVSAPEQVTVERLEVEEVLASAIEAGTSQRRRRQSRSVVISVAILACTLAYAWSLRATFVDDAFIQFRYARTLVESGTWGFYAGYPSNTATSPLNVLLIAAGTLVTGSAVTAAVVLTALELAALLWVTLRLSRHLFGDRFFGLLAFFALATNLLLVSTFGLESLLYVLLLVTAIALWLERRWTAMAVVCGLLTLARPDGVLLALILLIANRLPLYQRFRLAATYGAVIAPWFVVSWLLLGSFVPDTLVIKIEQSAWGVSTFATGLRLYLDRYPFETRATLALAPLGLGCLWRCNRRALAFVGILAAYGAAPAAACSLLEVPPYHWYYIHQVAPLMLIAAVGARCLVAPVRRWRGVWALVLVPAAGLVILVAREGFPLTEAPINTNWATAAEYRTVGTWLRDNLEPETSIAIYGEIGTIAYYSDQYLVNEFSDMSVADEWVKRTRPADVPVLTWLYDLNFSWRDDHPPLPPPTLELHFHPGPAPRGCPSEDPSCAMAWGGGTAWTNPTTILLRRREPDANAPPDG